MNRKPGLLELIAILTSLITAAIFTLIGAIPLILLIWLLLP
jgi:hypothetical protein